MKLKANVLLVTIYDRITARTMFKYGKCSRYVAVAFGIIGTAANFLAVMMMGVFLQGAYWKQINLRRIICKSG